MHLACLGVMRRLLMYWKGPVGPLHVRLGQKRVIELSRHLIHLSPFVPIEFARTPRAVDEVLRWPRSSVNLCCIVVPLFCARFYPTICMITSCFSLWL